MKTFRNLMLLLVTASLLSSCLVQDRGPRPHRHHHRPHGPGWHRGY